MDLVRRACLDCFNDKIINTSTNTTNNNSNRNNNNKNLNKHSINNIEHNNIVLERNLQHDNSIHDNSRNLGNNNNNNNQFGNNENEERIDETNINTKFTQLINDLGLDEKAKETLNEFSKEKKIQLYKQMSFSTDKSSCYVEKLKSFNQLNSEASLVKQEATLERLRALLRSGRVSFVEQFFANEGLDHLLDYIQLTSKSPSCQKANLLALTCLKSTLNCLSARKSVIKSDRAINLIALRSSSILNPNPKSRLTCIQILSALCMVPGGHNKVINSFNHLQQYSKERIRFQSLLYDLDVDPNLQGDFKVALDLKGSILAFINSVINYGPGEKLLEYRMHLRYELLMLGIEGMIFKLKGLAQQSINKHIEFFEYMRKRDEKEFLDKNSLKKRVDSKSLSSIVEHLKQKYLLSPIYSHLLSILFHLTLITHSTPTSELQWRLVDKLVQEISLKEGEESEVLLGQHIKSIISKLTQENNVKETQKKLNEVQKNHLELKMSLEKKEKECENKSEEKKILLNTLETLKMKLEKDSFEYKKKINELTSEIQYLKQNNFKENLNNESFEKKVSNENVLEDNMNNDSSRLPSTKKNLILSSSLTTSPLSPLLPPPPPPPPPPLPPSFSSSVTQVESIKKNIPQPSQSTKCFNWTKVPPSKIKSSVWHHLSDEEIFPLLDLEDLEKNFSAYQRNEQDSSCLASNKNLKVLSLLDGKRSQNCTIMLSKLKITNYELIQIVKNADLNDDLPKDLCEQLLKFIPSPEEIQMLKEHEGEVENMARADRFLYDISQVDHYEAMLKSLCFKKKFNERMSDLEPRIKDVMTAAYQLTNSSSFEKCLEIILALGNFLNKGQRGNAYGFKLSSLPKLSDTKSSIKKSTLLHYMVELCDEKFPETSSLLEDLNCVKKASLVTLPEIEIELKKLKEGLIEVEVEKDYQKEKKLIGSNPFCDSMDEFLQISQCRVDQTDERFKEMKSMYQNCLELFCEEKSVQPEEFFKYVAVTLEGMEEVRRENLIFKKMKDEEEQRALKEAQMKVDKEKKKQITTNINNEDEQLGEFDQLIKTLMSGEAYQVRGKGKRGQGRKGSLATETHTYTNVQPYNNRKNLLTTSNLTSLETLKDSTDYNYPVFNDNESEETHNDSNKKINGTKKKSQTLESCYQSRERINIPQQF